MLLLCLGFIKANAQGRVHLRTKVTRFFYLRALVYEKNSTTTHRVPIVACTSNIKSISPCRILHWTIGFSVPPTINEAAVTHSALLVELESIYWRKWFAYDDDNNNCYGIRTHRGRTKSVTVTRRDYSTLHPRLFTFTTSRNRFFKASSREIQ